MEAVRLAGVLGLPLLAEAVGKAKYREVKDCERLEERRQVSEDVRRALKGWVRNAGDDEFSLSTPPGS
jgi:tRNA-specific adenosine deaminase 1